MAKELRENKGKPIGLFDSDNGESLMILKSVDITDECPVNKITGRKVIIDFTVTQKGSLFKLTKCYPGETYGESVHNHVHNLDSLDTDKTVVFSRYAKDFGLSPEKLREIVKRELSNTEASRANS